MKRLLLFGLLAAALLSEVGCCRNRMCCGSRGLFGGRGGGYDASYAEEAGPAVGTVAYPYYTVRAPRDFLAKNPPSIGP